jgi:hypothetical protein
MPSEFSKDMARKVGHIMAGAAQAAAYDRELQEVREVLDQLRWQVAETEPCWCRVRVNGIHDDPCQRTRALYQRLRIE